jgi:upstream activation factor subunit UAF30
VKKETKRESSSEDADARLAAELQAQEEKLARGRTTRGGGKTKENKKSKPKNKKTKPKSAKRVRDDDDSDISGADSGDEKPKSKARGGFQKPFNLSHQLAELCGETQVSESVFRVFKGDVLTLPNLAIATTGCQEAMGAH